MKHIKITTLKPSQWKLYKKIRLIALKTVPIAFGETYKKIVSHPDTYWQEALSSPNSLWLFVFDNAQPIAMMGSYINDNGQAKGIATVVGVYVDIPYQGQGIGKQLMKHLLNEITGYEEINKIKIWVSETQKHAISLYQSCGFAFIGKNKNEVLLKENILMN